jgi:hypothetical protein
MKRILFVSFFCFPTVFANNLGQCPNYTAADCKSSLSKAANKITNCKLSDPETRQCAEIFVETLSSADDKAPFFEGLYRQDYEVGDIQAYRNLDQWLKNQSMEGWLALRDLSKAMILQLVDFNTLTQEQKSFLDNLLGEEFLATENMALLSSTPGARQDFIEGLVKKARAIQWPPQTKTIEIN